MMLLFFNALILCSFATDYWSTAAQILAWLNNNRVCWLTDVRYFYFKVIDLKENVKILFVKFILVCSCEAFVPVGAS